MNRMEIETAVSRLLGDLLLEGTVDAASQSIITDSDIIFPESSLLRGMDIYLKATTSPTIADTSRVIASSAQGSVGIVPTLGIAPTVGDTYNIYRSLRHADYLAAINTALRTARELHLVPFSATLGLVATQWEYAVPVGFRYISSLWIVPSANTDYTLDNYKKLERASWNVRINPAGSRVINFDPRLIDLDDYDNEIVVLRGQRVISSITSATYNIETELEDYLVHKAATLLQLPGAKSELDIVKYRALLADTDRLERRITSFVFPNSVEVL